MDENKRKKSREKFELDVKWLKAHLAPDDVYDFSIQAVYIAEYLLAALGDLVDLDKEMDKDINLERCAVNLMSFVEMQRSGTSIMIDTNIFAHDEDNNSG